MACSEITLGCHRGNHIGEYDKDGNATREYIYLKNQPICLFTAEKQGELLQIHTDHLGTPRAVSNAKKEILWRWDERGAFWRLIIAAECKAKRKRSSDQFGDVQPQIKIIKLPLRHSEQYADDETGLFYNYHRYYDPSMGRYISSDPLGLTDGTNPFNYVHANPIAKVDPDGQWAILVQAGSYIARRLTMVLLKKRG